ncbi:MAG: DUF4388 domain-containing protein, partial [Thermomicrobiaceae bacterium]
MRGSLEEFSLGDILQLYQISGRTGIVRAWRGESLTHVIHVDRGRVSGAGADQWNLIEEIRKIEWLTEEVASQLNLIVRDGDGTGLSLIARALLSSYAWDCFCERQLERLVYPVLIWSTGEFEAAVSEVPRVAPLRINQSPQQLVLSAARWEEELRSAESAGFNRYSRWQRTDVAHTMTFDTDEHHQLVPLMERPRSIE